MSEFKKNLSKYKQLIIANKQLKKQISDLRCELISEFESNQDFQKKKYVMGEVTISYANKKTYQGLSQSFLRSSISNYIDDTNCDLNVDALMDYILSKRAATMKGNLVFKFGEIDDDEDQ